jgi:hypothetical protein
MSAAAPACVCQFRCYFRARIYPINSIHSRIGQSTDDIVYFWLSLLGRSLVFVWNWLLSWSNHQLLAEITSILYNSCFFLEISRSLSCGGVHS